MTSAKIAPKMASLYFAAVGVSISTLIFGATSAAYYTFALLSLILALPRSIRKSNASQQFILAIIFSIIAVAIYHELYSSEADHSSFGQIIRASSIIAVIVISLSASSLTDQLFQRGMAVVSSIHVMYFIFALTFRHDNFEPGERLYLENAATAALAEIALGMAWAAILSRNPLICIAAIPLAFTIILLTQMRTTGVALSASIFFIISSKYISQTKSKNESIFKYVIFCLAAIAASIYLDNLIEITSKLLLLDDPNRGVSSGFSGRGDNIREGIDLTLDHLLLGNGFQNTVVNYIHNGYILLAAQVGIPLATPFFILIFTSFIISAYRHKSPEAAVVVGYFIFLMAQPRNINFQLCVFIGFICAVRNVAAFSKLHFNTSKYRKTEQKCEI